MIQRDGKRAVREGVRDSSNLLSNLTHVRNAIRRDGHNPARRARILESLQRVVPGVGFQSWTTPASTAITPEGFGLLLFE